ncbi:MAG: DMT family transporter [Verrucomicrobia bacterium]|nr:DMT family transporter [Verrucomicrobiota bacterium]
MNFHSHGHQQHIALGVVFAVMASICFTLMSLLTKVIGTSAKIDLVLFSRFFVSFLLLLPLALKHPRELIIVQPFKLVFRTIFTLFGLACLFYSLRYISLTDALLLTNTSPLFIPILVLIAHQAKTPSKVWGGIILGFIGIALVLHPGVHLFQPVALIALASGLFAGIAFVIIRSLTKSLSIIQILFYNFLFASLVTACVLPFGWVTPNDRTLWLLLGVGIFGAGYQFLSTLSIAKAPIRITSSLQFLSIVFGAIADFLIWKQVPDLFSFMGICLVILGGILAIYFGQKEIKTKS